jgi:hypothetical protein
MKESHKSSVCMASPGVKTRSDRLSRACGSDRQGRPVSRMAAVISESVAGSSDYCMANVSVKLPPAPRTNRPLRLVDVMLTFKKP